MGSLSDYAENKLLDLALGGAAFDRPANVYLSAHTTTLTDAGSGTEVTGNNYSRKAVANNPTSFPAASGLSKALAVAQDFDPASGSWGSVTDTGLWDAASAGNLLVADTNADPITVGAGVTYRIPANTGLVVTLGGAISSYLANKLLDHLLGGGDFTPPAIVYLGLFVAGVEVTGNNYSRKSVINDLTNFPAASGGAKSMATAQEFAPPTGSSSSWGIVDEVRIFDAASAGNLLLSKALITPRTIGLANPARFSAGALTFSLS